MSDFRRRLFSMQGGAPVANVGDIAYKASNGSIKVINPDEWSTSLGTPVGVVVIPSGFAPDNGLARIISLNWGSSSSTSSTSTSIMRWSTQTADTSLKDYDRVPTTDNAGSTTTGSYSYGYLPSDKFTGTQSYVDPITKYKKTTYMIPSPYLGDKPNPAYYSEISGYNNALADFDGKDNTDVLVALGADYVAANAARNYKAAGAEEIEWYLPAMGELGYLMVRFNKIQAALTKVNAPQLDGVQFYGSSSEGASLRNAFQMLTNEGTAQDTTKANFVLVRPFAQLDF